MGNQDTTTAEIDEIDGERTREIEVKKRATDDGCSIAWPRFVLGKRRRMQPGRGRQASESTGQYAAAWQG